MSPFNPGAAGNPAGTTRSPTPDTQTVIGLLGSLMPLLLQIQMQSRDQLFPPGPLQNPFQPGLGQPGLGQPGLGQPGLGNHFGNMNLGTPNLGSANVGGLNLAAPNPMIDHQAAVNLVEDITADSLRTLSTYLETYASQHQGLESCVPIVTQAAHCFAARDFAQTLDLIWQGYRVITALRAANPQLPPPRAAGVAGAPSATATNIH